MKYLLPLLLLGLSACAPDAPAPKRNDTPRPPDGMAVFRQQCVTCHGADGKLGLNGAKDLSASALTLEERVEIITNGRKLMAAYGQLLQADEIKAVAEFTMTIK